MTHVTDHSAIHSTVPLPSFNTPTFAGAPRLPLHDPRPRRIGKHEFDFQSRVALMAIINRTPDSFYDRGANFRLETAIASALAAVDEGADWIDVGGVPFGRGPHVDLQTELDRVVPTVEVLATQSDTVISVDTNRAEVAARAIEAGAAVVNDTSGFWDPEMPAVIAETGAMVVLTHSLWPPRSEPVKPLYDDVVTAVEARLSDLIERALDAGIAPDRLIIDPGHDLNKNTLHSLELIRRLPEIVKIGYPTLVALSNKDFIGETLDKPKDDLLVGSLSAAVACVLAGARIVRTHNVSETVDAIQMAEAILGIRSPHRVWHNNGQN